MLGGGSECGGNERGTPMSQQHTTIERSIAQGWQESKAISQEAMVIVRMLRAIAYGVVIIGSLPAEVLLHTRFGVRYLNLYTLVLGAVFMLVPVALIPWPDGLLGLWAIGIYLLVAVFHMAHARIAEIDGKAWHSRSGGQPFKLWQHVPGLGSPFLVQVLVEPAVVATIGVIMVPLNLYGVYVVVVGGMLLTKKCLEFDRYRGIVLDQRDSQIEAQVMSAQEAGNRSAWDNEGYIVPPIAFARVGEQPVVPDVSGMDKTSVAGEPVAVIEPKPREPHEADAAGERGPGTPIRD